jgi:hypothetical protein
VVGAAASLLKYQSLISLSSVPGGGRKEETFMKVLVDKTGGLNTFANPIFLGFIGKIRDNIEEFAWLAGIGYKDSWPPAGSGRIGTGGPGGSGAA